MEAICWQNLDLVRIFSLLFLILAGSAEPGGAAMLSSCPLRGEKTGLVADVNERLELTLADGVILSMIGIESPQPTALHARLDVETRDKLRAWLLGHAVSYISVEEAQDRWGRLPAFVFAPSGKDAISVGEALLDAGLSRYMPGEAAHICHARLLAAEAGARKAGLGIWRDPYYAVIEGRNLALFEGKGAAFTVVEGEVTRIVPAKFRTRLYLGSTFSITILQRDNKMFEAAGMNVSRLLGQAVRVRGLLDLSFGPDIEVVRLDALEVLGKSSKAFSNSGR